MTVKLTITQNDDVVISRTLENGYDLADAVSAKSYLESCTDIGSSEATRIVHNLMYNTDYAGISQETTSGYTVEIENLDCGVDDETNDC